MTRAGLDRRTVLKTLAGGALLVGCGGATRVPDRQQRAPGEPGPSEAAMHSMHERMAGYVERGEVPGLVTLVARRGDVQVDVLGSKAAGGSERLQRDSIFRISSMTKPITAAAAMILVDDGKLRVDEPVDRLLPELANRRVLRRPDGPLDETVPAQRAITVRDLLTFTMGMGIVFAPPGSHPIQTAMDELALGQGMPSPQATPAPDERIRRLGTLPLIHQPGERWMYNTGSDVLAVLIARASGQTFEAFLGERIFAPLGMKDTSFSVPPSKLHRLVTSYLTDADKGTLSVYDRPDGQWSRPPAFPSGSAGLVATADDFLAFGQMLLDQGQHGATRVLSPGSVAAMTRDQLSAGQKAASEMFGLFEQHGWGFGMSVVTGRDVAGAVGAVGWDGGLGTSWRTDPARQAVTILLTQAAWTSPVPPPVCHDFWTSAGEALAR